MLLSPELLDTFSVDFPSVLASVITASASGVSEIIFLTSKKSLCGISRPIDSSAESTLIITFPYLSIVTKEASTLETLKTKNRLKINKVKNILYFFIYLSIHNFIENLIRRNLQECGFRGLSSLNLPEKSARTIL